MIELGWRGWEAGLHGVAGRRIWGDMGAAARAGRDAYARAYICLVDASERRLASRKSIAREEDLELYLWAPHWNGGSILDFACFFCDLSAVFCDLPSNRAILRPVGAFLRPVVVCGGERRPESFSRVWLPRIWGSMWLYGTCEG